MPVTLRKFAQELDIVHGFDTQRYSTREVTARPFVFRWFQ
jgi:hypothetical protein